MRYVRYVIRPRAADWGLDQPLLEGRTVHEPEPARTGLVDKDGNPIIRLMAPIGFVPLRERT